MSTQALVKTALRIGRQLLLFGELAVPKTTGEESIGSRVARLRREKGLTQVELAQALGVSQPMVSDYEKDVSPLSSVTIIKLAQILDTSADEILGLSKPVQRALGMRSAASFKNRRLYRQLQSIDRLPKRDQQALLRTIDAFLAKGQ